MILRSQQVWEGWQGCRFLHDECVE
jgi:hypothetical protein